MRKIRPTTRLSQTTGLNTLFQHKPVNLCGTFDFLMHLVCFDFDVLHQLFSKFIIILKGERDTTTFKTRFYLVHIKINNACSILMHARFLQKVSSSFIIMYSIEQEGTKRMMIIMHML